MFRMIKRYIIICLSLVVMYTSTVFSYVTFDDALFNHIDYLNTYANFKRDPSYALNSDLLVIGDSYAFLLATNCGYGLDYIVHQGYTVEQIHNELLPGIPHEDFKYAFVFIGPNDFMRQTHPVDFKVNLQMIINELKFLKMKPVFVTYLHPNYELFPEMLTKPVACSEYNIIINDLVAENDLLYMDIVDLINKYGYIEGDIIHPSYDMYKPLMDRLIKFLREDMQ